MNLRLTYWICQQAIRYRDKTHNSEEAKRHLEDMKSVVDKKIDLQDYSLRTIALEGLSIDEIERHYIKMIIENTGTYAEAARILGISQATLLNRRKEYGID